MRRESEEKNRGSREICSRDSVKESKQGREKKECVGGLFSSDVYANKGNAGERKKWSFL